MLSGWFDDYNIETNTPSWRDFVDFKNVRGPEIYHFVSSTDDTCIPEQANFMESMAPTHRLTKVYECSSHAWFGTRGTRQNKWL
jgi:hypothetical protein